MLYAVGVLAWAGEVAKASGSGVNPRIAIDTWLVDPETGSRREVGDRREFAFAWGATLADPAVEHGKTRFRTVKFDDTVVREGDLVSAQLEFNKKYGSLVLKGLVLLETRDEMAAELEEERAEVFPPEVS